MMALEDLVLQELVALAILVLEETARNVQISVSKTCDT